MATHVEVEVLALRPYFGIAIKPMYGNVNMHNLEHGGCKRVVRPVRARVVGHLRVVLLMVALFAIIAMPSRALAQPNSDRGSLIEAAYLLKFPLYITWPEDAFENDKSPIVIGVLENGGIGNLLQKHAPKVTAKGRKIIVLRFKTMKDYKPCHILFVPKSATDSTQEKAISQTRKSPVLVVGEESGFVSAGGTASFYRDINNTIGFDINRDATKDNGLRVDARLLKLARVASSSRGG
jgi:hypothetical protein